MDPFRSSSPEAERLSQELRRARHPLLRRRRQVAALSAASIVAMTVVSMYQLGVVRRLPDPPGPFDSNHVDASGEAYTFGRMPDAPPAVLGYAASLVLASIGGADRAQSRPALPLLLAVKSGVDAIGGLWLTAEQAKRHRRFCSWCVTTTAASVAAAALSIPEARAALRHMRS